MSIEVEVRLGSQEVAKEAFAQALSASLRMRAHGDAFVSWQPADAGNASIGNRESRFSVTADAGAEVECLVFSAGPEEDLGDEGGWWVTVSVVERNASSYLLMLLTAACLAELADSAIVDDALMLKMGREIEPADLHAAMAPHRQASFAQTGAAVAAALAGKT